MRIKLQWKLTAIFCLLAVFILAAAYIYFNSHLKSFLLRDIESNLKKELFLSKDYLESEFNRQPAAAVSVDLANRIGADLGVRVTIISPDGTVLGDSEVKKEDLPKLENHLSRPEVQQALKEGFGASQRYSYTLKKYMLYNAAVVGKEKPVAILRLVIPVAKVAEFEAGMQKILAVGVVMVFFASLVLSFLISMAVTRPLANISSAAKAMASGDFSRKVFNISRDEIGDLAATLNYMSDEIKAKIEKVRSGEAKLETVLSGMVEGVIVTDAKGKIILANPSLRKLFFIDTAPEGKTPLEVVRNSAVQNIADRVLKGGQRIAVEEIGINSPEEKFIKVSGVAIIKEEQCEGAIFVFHDITELRRLEKVRQDFVANVSHELRTPLSSIKGYSETLIGGVPKEEDRKEFLGIIQRESDRLAKLIDDLLDLSKIESGKMAMVFMPVEINPVVKRSAGVLEKSARDKSIKVEFNIPEGLPKVMADENRLSQVFLNLLDNAIKYTPEGGSVKISVFPQDKYLQVDVTDTGVGIPESDLPRVFERFYRVDKARSRQLGGTGLGLSIVKHIVQSHGGQVWVKSEPGRGSTFSFTIPKA
ncbi:MAG: ATP-binding protein [Candidatus Omnitrophica bacterium]|nr:ATP-binding protein [Candidatus Omnitrophota bacterium]MDD5547207.1 ATP-binding protein [Candidatus Omnitrophota bacterium]